MPPHFHFGLHSEHGVVARPTTAITLHLAHWYLTREQFEPVPGRTGLYRLTSPDQDARRRGRQAVHDLRRRGFTVQADISLDPAQSAPPPAPARRDGLAERRARIAQAAAGRSTQRHAGTAPSITAQSPVAGPPPVAAASRRR